MHQQESKRGESQNRQSSETNRQSLTSGQPRQSGVGPYGFGFAPGDLLRMNPFVLMRRMSDEMERFFSGSASSRGGAGWAPAIEVSQQGNDYKVCAELPGIDPNDVKVEVEQDAIVLQGERQWQNEEERAGVHHSERRYGSFYRSIPLPEGADAQQARARFENGLLEITVPLKEQASKRRQIPVQSGASTGSRSGSQTASAASGENKQTK